MSKKVTIGDIFDFNSELICNLQLSTIEEILFEQIKSNYDVETSINKIKFQEMKEITFEQFTTSKKFEEEFIKLKKITRKLSNFLFYLVKKISKQQDSLKDKIYCIHKSNLNCFHDDEKFVNLN
jgi:hypothetical protein